MEIRIQNKAKAMMNMLTEARELADRAFYYGFGTGFLCGAFVCVLAWVVMDALVS